MTSEILGIFKAFIKKIPLGILISIVSMIGLILFLPEDLARKLYVIEFRKDYGYFMGPLFLFTVFLLIARIFTFLIENLFSFIKRKRTMRIKHKLLHKLTPEEKGYLSVYINNKRNSINVGMDDGIMGGMEAKKIVFRSVSQGDLLNGFAYNLQLWAKEYLTKNPELLKGAEGIPMTPREKINKSWRPPQWPTNKFIKK